MPKPLSPEIAHAINKYAVTFCNFFYEHPEDAIQHAISALDNIGRDYESTYGMVRGMYTQHPEKLSTTKTALNKLRESYRDDNDNVSAAQGAIGEIINFLRKSTNWSKGKQIPFTSTWLLYPSINNRFVAHVMTHAGVSNTEDILEEAQEYFLTAVRTEADRRARQEQAALEALIARHSPRVTTTHGHLIESDVGSTPATVEAADPAPIGMPATGVQTDTRTSSPWNDGTSSPPLRFTPPLPPAQHSIPDDMERDAASNVAVIFDMHGDEQGQGLTKRRGFGFNNG